jgi:PDZ domain-containing protein
VRRRRLLLGAIVAVAVLIVASVVASFVPVSYDAITPGSAVPVTSLISVPGDLAEQHLGTMMLTDVELVPLHALSYLYYELQSGVQIVQSSEIVGTATASQYERQGEVDMIEARQAATVVALHELGYPTRAIPDGVIVYQPEAGSPAARGLAVGDVVTAVDGREVRTIAGLATLIGDEHPGAFVTLTVRGIFTTMQHVVRLPLGEERVAGAGSSVSEVCAGVGADNSLQPVEQNGSPAACLGVYPEQDYATRGLPYRVAISSDGIIGPSAGLAFTLGLIDELDKNDLLAGLKVAATGTMSVTGQVGQVGGVAQKTIAVRNAGASVFFVPLGELHQALPHAGPHLTVMAVSSIGQAIVDLEQLGGRLTPPVRGRLRPRLARRA